jgi:ARC6-like, IMS domain
MGVIGVVQLADVLWYASEKGVESLDIENRQVLGAVTLEARCLLADPGTGLLLCGTDDGILGYQGNRWQALEIAGSASEITVRALAVDAQKTIWCASNLGLGKIIGSFETGFTWQLTYDTTHGLPTRRVDCLCIDSQSTLWCGTAMGLARYQPQANTFIVDPAIDAGVIALAADQRGQLYLATAEGLSKWDGARWSALSGWRQYVSASATPQCLLADNDGSIWCGTSAGLVLRNEGIWQGIELGESVSVRSLAVDPHGNLWCGTDSGLMKVENGRGITLQAFLEKPVLAPIDPPQAATLLERPTTVSMPVPPTVPPLAPTVLLANNLSQPTVLNPQELSAQPTVVGATEPLSQPTVLDTTEPASQPTTVSLPNSYIRLYVTPTQSTIPIGGKEIFRIQVERQNTDASISFAGLSGSQGISATVIQKDASTDWANLLVTATEEAVPGNYTLRVQAEAPGIVIYSCSVEITVVSGEQELTVKIPTTLSPTLVPPAQPKPKQNLMPLVAVVILFLGGGGLIWLLGRPAGNSASTPPIPETTRPKPVSTSKLQPDPEPPDPPIKTDPQPQPTVKSNDFNETVAASVINSWQQIKQEVFSDPQNVDGETKLRSILTGVMLNGSSGSGGRLNSWQQLRTQKQFWHYTQSSVALVPGTFQRVDDHTAFAVIAITESGEKFDAEGNLLKDAGSPYYNSTYQVKYRFAYDDQTQGWRLAECWGTTKTLKSCDLDRES